MKAVSYSPCMTGQLSSSLPKGRIRGVTLVELMVVVTIVGILSVVMVRSLTKHADASRTVEALTMVQSVRAAQERHRAMNLVYLDVSQSDTWYPRNPIPAGIGRDRMAFYLPDGAHPDGERWVSLNPTVGGPVQFGYMTRSGLAGETMTEPAVAVPELVWPATTDAWYVIQAVADADGDGDFAYYLASSVNGEVYRANEGE